MSAAKMVAEIVGARRGVSVSEIFSTTRIAPVAHARQEAIYILKSVRKQSFPQIGRAFDRDHTTVLYSIGAVSLRMQSLSYGEEIAEMTEEFQRRSGLFPSRMVQKMGVFKSARASQ